MTALALRLGFGVAVAVVLSTSHAAAAQAASGDCDGQGSLYCPTSSGDGYVYAWDASTQTFVPVPTSAAGTPDPLAVYRYAVSPACPQAQPFGAINCTAAAEFCAQNGQAGIHEDVWREEVSPTPSQWQVVGQMCSDTQGPPISAQQIVQDASEYERDHMPVPVPNVQPANVAIVNLPVLVSVPQPGPQTMQVQQPVPGLLVATPTYTWKFDDGATVTGAGLPYDGTDPRVDPGHYASHTYTAAEAQASVTLTVTWNATFTVAGRAFTIPPLVMSPITTTFSVHEAHSVLVSGNEP